MTEDSARRASEGAGQRRGRNMFDSRSMVDRIADLSPQKRQVLERLLKKQASPLSPIPPRGSSAPAALSFAQQRLWFLNQLATDNAFYNVNTAIRLTTGLDRAALQRSLNEIVRRHAALRTTFPTVDRRPVQAVADSLALALPVVDLRGLPAGAREAEAARLATEEAQRPFDLAGGPLVRASLLQLDDADYVFLLTMHHIVSDGWSMGVFFR